MAAERKRRLEEVEKELREQAKRLCQCAWTLGDVTKCKTWVVEGSDTLEALYNAKVVAQNSGGWKAFKGDFPSVFLPEMLMRKYAYRKLNCKNNNVEVFSMQYPGHNNNMK